MARPYTGNTDPSSGPRPGAVQFQKTLCFLFGMQNLGIWVNRPVRGVNRTALSVHATGRAMDTGGTATQCKDLINFLWSFRDKLLIEELHDYRNLWIPGKGFGAGYRCNRDNGGLLSGWKVYANNTIGSGGLWVHTEVAPAMADDPARVDSTFKEILDGIEQALRAPK